MNNYQVSIISDSKTFLEQIFDYFRKDDIPSITTLGDINPEKLTVEFISDIVDRDSRKLILYAKNSNKWEKTKIESHVKWTGPRETEGTPGSLAQYEKISFTVPMINGQYKIGYENSEKKSKNSVLVVRNKKDIC